MCGPHMSSSSSYCHLPLLSSIRHRLWRAAAARGQQLHMIEQQQHISLGGELSRGPRAPRTAQVASSLAMSSACRPDRKLCAGCVVHAPPRPRALRATRAASSPDACSACHLVRVCPTAGRSPACCYRSPSTVADAAQ